MIHWLWALAAFIFGGSLGTLIMAVIIGGSGGEEVVEDAKGVKTAVYQLKKKLMADRYGILIQEV